MADLPLFIFACKLEFIVSVLLSIIVMIYHKSKTALLWDSKILVYMWQSKGGKL